MDEIKRLLIAMQHSDQHKIATPANWQPGDDVIVPPPGSCGAAKERMEKPGRGRDVPRLVHVPEEVPEITPRGKIAFSTSGEGLDAPLDTRFGRAPRFLVYDLDTGAFEVIDNRQSLNAAQGAGIQAAETVARSGAKALVTGHCGPKAFRVLRRPGSRSIPPTPRRWLRPSSSIAPAG